MIPVDASEVLIKAHAGVFLTAAAAYYKYGDRTDLFDKALKGNHSIKKAVRDRIATELGAQLRPSLRSSLLVRSSILDADGSYIERTVDVTESEPFHEAVRDFVTQDVGGLVDYRCLLRAMELWRRWSQRLSTAILVLLIMEGANLAIAVAIRILMEPTDNVRVRFVAMSLGTTSLVVGLIFLCLVVVHINHGRIVELREQYDPAA